MAQWTITNGTNLSTDYVDLMNVALVALEIPTGYNGGNITFKAASTSNGTYADIYDSLGAIVTLNVGGGNRIVAITGTPLQALASISFVKLVTATNVTGNQVINIIGTTHR